MSTYLTTDGHGGEIELKAGTALAACKEYVEGGDYAGDKTTWVSVRTTRLHRGKPTDDTERHTITVEPNEPDCRDGEVHDWQSPYSVLGGLKENPGVQGHGGGVIIAEVCQHCRAYRITNTWAQNPENGQQGLCSVEYREADKASQRWTPEP